MPEDSELFRRRAEEAEELARKISFWPDRDKLLAIAQEWRALLAKTDGAKRTETSSG